MIYSRVNKRDHVLRKESHFRGTQCYKTQSEQHDDDHVLSIDTTLGNSTIAGRVCQAYNSDGATVRAECQSEWGVIERYRSRIATRISD